MKRRPQLLVRVVVMACCSVFLSAGILFGQAEKKPSSYSPVVITEPFDS